MLAICRKLNDYLYFQIDFTWFDIFVLYNEKYELNIIFLVFLVFYLVGFSPVLLLM
jgi:hypothetical protein